MGDENSKVIRHAIKVSRDWMPPGYESKVDESILGISFEPDVFQKQAFYFLSSHNSVFVSAHTSSGKTLVAEYAISTSLRNGTRTIYTSPIKALSNQKFHDFKQKYDSVGIMTGDVQVNTNAQCLIMTTEILRNLLYKNSDILRDTEFVIFDEVHYVNDAERGVVWEEAIIMLPKNIALVMLSATIPNSVEFSEWVGRTKERCVYVISTNKRAVPLEFAIYCNSEAFSIEDSQGKPAPTNFPSKLVPYSKRIARGTDRFRIADLANFVVNRSLTPAIFFCFSKKSCNSYARSLELLDLTSSSEKSIILSFIEESMAGLSEEDKHLPQIQTMKNQTYKGIAVHHSGLLPFVRECVEILFSRNLIKILIATETFAVGVNMPAKCCVFLGVTKIDSGRFRPLIGSEFIQMSGRAGRRGKDKVGTVIITGQNLPHIDVIKQMVHGTADNLGSRFRLSFSLILSAIRSKIDVEDLMKKSFRENSVQKNIWTDMKRIAELEEVERFSCDECADIFEFLERLKIIYTENSELLRNSAVPGSCFVLKNNSIVRCESVSGDVLRCTSLNEKLEGPLFTVPSQTLVKPEADYPALPPTQYSQTVPPKVQFRDILFLVKDNKIAMECSYNDIHLLSMFNTMQEAYGKLCDSRCIHCPLFEKHYYDAIRYEKVQKTIKALKSKYSRENLSSIDEYSARMKFLHKNGFVDENSITLKGRVAAEIRTINEVLATELIFKNVLESFTPPELAAIFSAMISEESLGDEEIEIQEVLREKVQVLDEANERHTAELESFGIPIDKTVRHGMTNAVYDWSCGSSLGEIVARYKIQEGSFVRLILRLEECCNEMIVSAQAIGNSALEEKFKEAGMLIKRDVVFTPSLYI